MGIRLKRKLGVVEQYPDFEKELGHGGGRGHLQVSQ
jgi:hypothetical protein